MSDLPFPLECAPCDEQKDRLENWLSEMMLISRRYNILIHADEENLSIVDVLRGTTIGLDLVYNATHERIHGYDCGDSILDGVWLVDTDTGPQEQRDVGSVWPRRNGSIV